MKYSERLGEITHDQFQKALDTFGLGNFMKAEPVPQGLFGQNVFLTSDKGEFILRGKPHYDWQFMNEKLMAELLHQHTKVPVPFPYLLYTQTEIFGWEYVIMPRMKGKNLSDDLKETFLTDSDRIVIARGQGSILREAQKPSYEFCGKYDLQSNSIRPYAPDWFSEFTKQIKDRLETSARYNDRTPQEDLDWVEEMIEQARNSLEQFTPTFFMQDFKPGNMVVDRVDGQWKVTGLFDLMEASIGHPESDISRMFAVYVERGREDLAYAFINSYVSQEIDLHKFAARFPLFMLHDRSIIWEWVQRTENAWWDKSWTFQKWTKPFLKIDPDRIHPSP